MKNYKIIGYCFIMALIIGCQKDDISTTIITQTPDEPGITIQTTVSGLITDMNGIPIQEATIYSDSESTVSDENGAFRITAKGKEKGDVLRIEKSTYFTAYPAYTPSEHGVARLDVQMIKKEDPSVVLSSQGGIVSINNMASVSFAANAFLDEDGNDYNGSVYVYSAYLDPTDESLSKYMPGDLSAIQEDGTLALLQTFGMVNVEIEDGSGNKLNLNTEAELKMVIPDNLLASSPDNIPLWHFDTDRGIWMEEGSAQKAGNEYVGMVSHFSFWNCDTPFDYVFLEGQLDISGVAPNLFVRATWLANGQTAVAYPDDKGYFGGKVPANAELLIEVLSYCGDVVYSDQIGPLSSDTDLGVIDLSGLNFDHITLSGRIVDCQGYPVSNGYVHISIDGTGPQSIHAGPDGTFSNVVFTCSEATIEITAIDIGIYQSGEPVIYQLVDPLNVGDIQACGNSTTSSVEIFFNSYWGIIDNCEFQGVSDQSGVTTWTFLAIDDQTDGAVHYEITLIDWGGDPAQYQIGWESNVFGAPFYHFWVEGDGDVIVHSIGDQPGDFVHFDVLGASIADNTGQTTNMNTKIIVKCLID